MTSFQRSITRRDLIKGAATAGAAAAIPYLIPSGVLAVAGRPGANETIGIGIIGCGRRAQQLLGDLQSVTGPGGPARIVALSDIWPKKWQEWIAAYEKDRREKGVRYATYPDYRKLLERSDVDGVVIATCDHWHALPAIHACQAGKDVYGEKPLSLTIHEGRQMVEAARKHQRVFQTGAQQRSMLRNRQACELIRNGRLGQIKEVVCALFPGARPASEYHFKDEPAPAGMDWDCWCGQTELAPFSFNRYLTYENPGWQWIREYSGGLLTNWGAHGLDMVQWALGTDDTGPVEIEPHGNSFDSPITYRYASGILLKLDPKMGMLGGGHFIGTSGELFMDRGRFNTVPKSLAAEPLSEKALHLEVSDHHMRNWLDCIKSRRRCISDVEIGHRSATICHLGGIARRLGRKLRWDPKKEVFTGDAEANALLARPRRKAYELPETL